MTKNKQFDTMYGYAPPGTAKRKAKERAAAYKPFTLEESIKWVGKAVATESNRPVLTWGTKLEMGGRMAGVGSDGYRVHFDFENGHDFDEQMKYAKSYPLDTFKFPDVTCIIPFDTESVGFNVEMAVKGVKRALVFGRDSAYLVTFKFKENVLSIIGKSPEYGDCTTELEYWDLATREFVNFSVNFNGHYLLDALEGFCKEDAVAFHYVGVNNVHYITNLDGDKRLAAMMPMSKNR